VSSGDQQIRSVLSLIRELSGRATRADSATELFSQALAVFHRVVPFDVAAAVMLESNLDLHIVTREGLESLVNDRFIGKIREQLLSVIPADFTDGDIVVKGERHVLPARETPGDCLAYSARAIVNIASRTSGLLLFFRCEEFQREENDLIDIFCATLSIVLANMAAQERILNLAETDDLTGIWNKRSFRRHLPQEVERARIYGVPLSLLMFDVDDFKDVNDTHGHTAGDVVLSELCGAVRGTLRAPDLFSRFGGDEFAVILPHTDFAGACACADRILSTVRQLEVPAEEDAAIRISISIGVAIYQDGDDAASLIRRADERLYVSKRHGKNRYTALA
jgi:diguanylate cyclase (GGDEF)-like protein